MGNQSSLETTKSSLIKTTSTATPTRTIKAPRLGGFTFSDLTEEARTTPGSKNFEPIISRGCVQSIMLANDICIERIIGLNPVREPFLMSLIVYSFDDKTESIKKTEIFLHKYIANVLAALSNQESKEKFEEIATELKVFIEQYLNCIQTLHAVSVYIAALCYLKRIRNTVSINRWKDFTPAILSGLYIVAVLCASKMIEDYHWTLKHYEDIIEFYYDFFEIDRETNQLPFFKLEMVILEALNFNLFITLDEI